MEVKNEGIDGGGEEDPAVTNFREYLRIETVQPTPRYEEADQFYRRQAKEIGLDFTSVKIAPGKPFAILTWKGQEPCLPSLMLYCHTDVVPVFPDQWKYPPFDAHKDEQGNIYGRGAQDMKCVGIQYLEAVRRLKKDGIKLKRTVHIVFGPGNSSSSSPSSMVSLRCPAQDEEIGSSDGMKSFVHRQEFKALNVGFGLDEGVASPTEEFRLFYGERSCRGFTVTFPGNPGHGSAFIENTAVSKLNKLMSRALQYRDEQEEKLKSSPTKTLGDVTTLNINILKGGVQTNVVPSEMSATFDVRVPPDEDLVKFKAMLHQWCREATPDGDYKLVFPQKSDRSYKSAADSSSPWWVAFESAIQKLGIQVKKGIFPASSDGLFLRRVGIPVYGFSPMNHTPILLHDHNEYLNEQVFLRGIHIYQHLIPALANVTAS